MLVNLAHRAPILAGADQMTFVDIDSLLRRVYGHQKRGARFGPAKVGGYSLLLRGLSPLVATVATPKAVSAGSRDSLRQLGRDYAASAEV